MKIAWIIFAAMCIISVGIEYINGKPINEYQIEHFMIPVAILFIFLLYFGSIKTGYHQSKYEKTGQITLFIDETYIKHHGKEFELNNNDFDIFFSNEGYEGRHDWRKVVSGAGQLIADSGINTISFKSKMEDYNYEVMIDNARQLNALNDMLKAIRETKSHF